MQGFVNEAWPKLIATDCWSAIEGTCALSFAVLRCPSLLLSIPRFVFCVELGAEAELTQLVEVTLYLLVPSLRVKSSQARVGQSVQSQSMSGTPRDLMAEPWS